MSFKPQTKRFALVPVEPGNEEDTDVEVRQDEDGDISPYWVTKERHMVLALPLERRVIAALGFPTEGEEA